MNKKQTITTTEVAKAARVTKAVRGFTIIEVVLVLAIAGLILLMALVAYPALQSGQRDTARKSDVSNIASAITTYSSNNRGTFPKDATDLGEFNTDDNKWSGYMSSVSANITEVQISDKSGESIQAEDGIAKVVKKAQCGDVKGTSVDITKGTTRQFVVITLLEAGGGSAFCQNS